MISGSVNRSGFPHHACEAFAFDRTRRRPWIRPAVPTLTPEAIRSVQNHPCTWDWATDRPKRESDVSATDPCRTADTTCLGLP